MRNVRILNIRVDVALKCPHDYHNDVLSYSIPTPKEFIQRRGGRVAWVNDLSAGSQPTPNVNSVLQYKVHFVCVPPPQSCFKN